MQINITLPPVRIVYQLVHNVVILQFEELGLHCFRRTGSFFDSHCIFGETDQIADRIVRLVNHLGICRAVTPCKIQKMVQTDVISD